MQLSVLFGQFLTLFSVFMPFSTYIEELFSHGTREKENAVLGVNKVMCRGTQEIYQIKLLV